jgi:hypothetical protein
MSLIAPRREMQRHNTRLLKNATDLPIHGGFIEPGCGVKRQGLIYAP